MTRVIPWISALIGTAALLVAGCGGRSTTSSERKEPVKEAAQSAAAAKEKGDEKPDAIELAPEMQTRLGIVVTPIGEAPLAVPLQVPGTVQPNESRLSHVRPLAR